MPGPEGMRARGVALLWAWLCCRRVWGVVWLALSGCVYVGVAEGVVWLGPGCVLVGVALGERAWPLVWACPGCGLVCLVWVCLVGVAFGCEGVVWVKLLRAVFGGRGFGCVGVVI